MRFIFAVSALIALGMAAPTAEADDTSPVEVDSSLLGMAACLPRTCQSYGVGLSNDAAN